MEREQLIRIVLLLFQKARIFTLYHVLNTIKTNFKTVQHLFVNSLCNSVCVIYDLFNYWSLNTSLSVYILCCLSEERLFS